MATSSIFTNIVMKDPEQIEKFIALLEKAEKEPPMQPAVKCRPVTDPEEIQKMFAKWTKKK